MGETTEIKLALNVMKDEGSAAGKLPRILENGQCVGRWRVLAFIAQGGFGQIYRVEHTKSGAIGALKILSQLDDNSRARFELESEILQTVYASRETARQYFPVFLGSGLHSDRFPYVVIEFLQPYKLPHREAKIVTFMNKMCEAVHELHRNGYLHRDIKPANVMMRVERNGNQTPVIIDFGCAIRIEDACSDDINSRLSMATGGVLAGIGTACSTAPEQASGIASIQSDVYALGSLLRSCFGDEVPEAWSKIVRKATEPQPRHRYEDPLSLAEAIDHRVKKGFWDFVRLVIVPCVALASGTLALVKTFCPELLSHDTTPAQIEVQPQSAPEQSAAEAKLEGLLEELKKEDAVATEPTVVTPMEAVSAPEADETPLAKATKSAIVAYNAGDFKEFFRLSSYADQEDVEFQLRMGYCLSQGKGFAKDQEKAAQWFRKAADRGDADALFELGKAYDLGNGVKKDQSQAVHMYLRAADKGHLEAMRFLGISYANGEGVEVDKTEAAKWYRKAAEQGYARAQNNLGRCYQSGNGVAQDDSEAVKWYRKAAEQGNASGQCNLGFMYEMGRGVAKDDSEAVEWYRKAAEHGEPTAQCNLGFMYEKGRGVAKNYEEAAKWYRKAAEQGYARAQNNLATLYRDGTGVAQDDSEAVKWYRKAAEQGNASGQCNLGFMYEMGRGVAKNYEEAVKWYLKAADLNNGDACCNLGWCYQKGIGIEPNRDQAVEYYKKAIDLGNTQALRNLSLLYMSENNFREAHKLLNQRSK